MPCHATLPFLAQGAVHSIEDGLVLARALKLAPAVTIAPFQYSQMTYAILAGLFVFGDLPDPLTLVGAAVIIASGLYLMRREGAHPPVEPIAPP